MNHTESPLAATSRARRALMNAKNEYYSVQKLLLFETDVYDEDLLHYMLQLKGLVDKSRREYIRCIHNSAPTVLFCVIASFLTVKERCLYATCSKFLHDEVVFGKESDVLVWQHPSRFSDYDFWMALKCQSKALRYLLKYGYANINSTHPQDYYRESALMYASRNSLETSVTMLIGANANVNQTNLLGDTALIVACEKWPTNMSIVKALVDSGADVNIRSKFGYTALMSACETPDAECVDVLLNANADTSILNATGHTALMIALKKKHTYIASLLQRASSLSMDTEEHR